MAKGERNRRYRKAALLLKLAGDSRPIKSITRQLRRNRNYRP
jgi:hypothetical protein